jgi:uncharacterized membrane protein
VTPVRLRAALVLVAVFAAGAVAGGAVAVHLGTRRFAAILEGDPKLTLPRLYGEVLGRRLHLTAQQRADVERIVGEDHAELARMGQSLYTEASEMRRRRHARIREILTPAQQPAFDALAAEYERRRRAEIDLPPAP